MIYGHPPNTSFRTLALEDFGVLMCGAQAGCPKGLGWRAHWYGRVDRAGTIHWKNADKRASKRGLRTMLKLLALAHNREWWTRPKFERLYLTNVWATKTAKARYHYLIRKGWSYSDRKEAFRLAKRSRKVHDLRRQYRGVYLWLMEAGIKWSDRVQSPSREGVLPDD